MHDLVNTMIRYDYDFPFLLHPIEHEDSLENVENYQPYPSEQTSFQVQLCCLSCFVVGGVKLNVELICVVL